jgi:hypothetical protein
MHTFYDFAKDFGGPIATILASAAALTVTYYFNKRQVAIAATQAETATGQRDIARLQHRRLRGSMKRLRSNIKLSTSTPPIRHILRRSGFRHTRGPGCTSLLSVRPCIRRVPDKSADAVRMPD